MLTPARTGARRKRTGGSDSQGTELISQSPIRVRTEVGDPHDDGKSRAGLLTQKIRLAWNVSAERASGSPGTPISCELVVHLLEHVERGGQQPPGDGGGGDLLDPPPTDRLMGIGEGRLGLGHVGRLAQHEAHGHGPILVMWPWRTWCLSCAPAG